MAVRDGGKGNDHWRERHRAHAEHHVVAGDLEFPNRPEIRAIGRCLEFGGGVDFFGGPHGEAAGRAVFRHLEIDGIGAAGRDRGHGSISGGRGECLDGEWLETFLGRGQFRGETLRAFHRRFRLHDVAHRLFRRHPWSAGLAPAGRIEQTDLDTDARAFADGVLDESPPLRGERLGIGIGRRAALAADDADERSADADAFHRLQILGDALLADVAIHPIPITTWLGGHGRLGKSRGQLVRRNRVK
jgi:hypothetical protein